MHSVVADYIELMAHEVEQIKKAGRPDRLTPARGYRPRGQRVGAGRRRGGMRRAMGGR